MAFALPVMQAVGSFAMANWGTLAMAGLSAAGGLASYQAQRQAGAVAQAQANYSADQLDRNARQERAIAHHQMAKQEREAKARASETKLGLLAGGMAGDDPSSAFLISENAGAETLEQLMTKALGEQRARGMEADARMLRYGGKQQNRAASLAAFGDALGSASSWYDRYGAAFGGNRSKTTPAPSGSGLAQLLPLAPNMTVTAG